MAFDAAIFFDNDQGYLDDVKAKCPGVTLVKVSDTPSTVNYSYKSFTYYPQNNLPMRSRTLTPGPLKDLMDSLYDEPTYNNSNNQKKKNGFISYLIHFKIIPKYHPESGITREDINTYYSWAKSTSGNRVLLLDWDQTLTQFDGLDLPRNEEVGIFYKNSPRENLLKQLYINPLDVAVFYLGGEKRFKMITDWLADVVNSGIHIIILTNNGGARDIIFKQIVDQIIPNGMYEIKASSFSPNYGDKGKSLGGDLRFSKLCTKTGGKRRRQTRRRKSRKQKNIH